MTGFTSFAPPANSVRVKNASATLNSKIAMATAKRCAACQSSEWKRESSSRRGGLRRRGLKLPYSTAHQMRRRRSALPRRSAADGGGAETQSLDAFGLWLGNMLHTIQKRVGHRQAR